MSNILFKLEDKINSSMFKIVDIYIPILFAGDRQICCCKWLHMYLGDKFIGVSSFSLTGETYNNNPEIVGIYVLQEYRNQGYAKQLIEKSYEEFSKLTNKKISITCINNNIYQLLNKYFNDKFIIKNFSI